MKVKNMADNSPTQERMLPKSGLHSTKVISEEEADLEVTNAASIKKYLEVGGHTGRTHIHINPLTYDISEEAAEPVRFHLDKYLEEIFVIVFYPISWIYVYFRHGYLKLQIMGLAPPDEPTNGKS